MEERSDGTFTKKVFITCIVWMRSDTNAGGKEFGTSRRDCKFSSTLYSEFNLMKGSSHRPILKLSLGHGGLKIDIPHRGRFNLFDFTLLIQIDERVLSEPTAMIVDSRIFILPVDGEAGSPKQIHEGFFVFLRNAVAELNKISSRYDSRTLFSFLVRGIFNF